MMLILEVMDKEPALRTVWGAALLLGLVGFLAARFRRWLVLPALGVIGFLAYWQFSELADPAVGPAIIQEAGRGYLIPSCAAVAVAGFLSGVGVGPERRAGPQTPLAGGARGVWREGFFYPPPRLR